MTPFQAQWLEIARRFQLPVRLDVPLTFDGEPLIVPVLLENFGAVHGMVLVEDFELLRPFARRIVEAGFGFSCLPGIADYPEATFIERLRDWGWSGPGSPPPWFNESSRLPA